MHCPYVNETRTSMDKWIFRRYRQETYSCVSYLLLREKKPFSKLSSIVCSMLKILSRYSNRYRLTDWQWDTRDTMFDRIINARVIRKSERKRKFNGLKTDYRRVSTIARGKTRIGLSRSIHLSPKSKPAIWLVRSPNEKRSSVLHKLFNKFSLDLLDHIEKYASARLKRRFPV